MPSLPLVPLGRPSSRGRGRTPITRAGSAERKAVSEPVVTVATKPPGAGLNACNVDLAEPRRKLILSGWTASADSLEFQVAGAGGVGAVTDGLYRQTGVHNGHPLHTQVDGDSVIYFADFWKLNVHHDLGGWTYFAPSWDEPHPPSGLWSTRMRSLTDADPAPRITVLRSTPAECFSSSPISAACGADGLELNVSGPEISVALGMLPEELEVCAPLSPTWSAAASTNICDTDVARCLRCLPNQKVALQLVKSLGRFSDDVSSLRGRHERQRRQTETLQKTLWPRETLDTHLTALQAENAHLTDWCSVRPSVLPAARRTLAPRPVRETVRQQGVFRDLLEQEAMTQEDLAGEKHRQWCPLPLSRPGHICEDLCARLYESEQELRVVLEEEQKLIGDRATLGMVRTVSDVRLRFEKDIVDKNKAQKAAAQKAAARSPALPRKAPPAKPRGRSEKSEASYLGR